MTSEQDARCGLYAVAALGIPSKQLRFEAIEEKMITGSNESLRQQPRRVSFSEKNDIWRPVLYESLEEHLCRLFDLCRPDQDRISKVNLFALRKFLQRSAQAAGHLVTYMPVGERFVPSDCAKWESFQEDGSVSLTELNGVLGSHSIVGFQFTPEHVDMLIKVKDSFPLHQFSEGGQAFKCADCGQMEREWCDVCDACASCSNQTPDGQFCSLGISN